MRDSKIDDSAEKKDTKRPLTCEPAIIPCIITRTRIRRLAPQLFAHPRAWQLDELIRLLPQRTIHRSGRRNTFLLCGERTTFNPDGGVKHSRTLPLEILIDPGPHNYGTLESPWKQAAKDFQKVYCGLRDEQ
jgi:hypothetical protein